MSLAPPMHMGQFIPVLSPTVNQTASIATASAAISNAVGSATEVVRVVGTVACHIAVGAAEATAANPLLPANTIEYFKIKGATKVAAIRIAAGSTGTLHVTEMK